MRIEVLAVGTELLLGQIVDTNSAWMGEQLALAGIDSHFHQAVGDNQARIVLALRTALARSDGVVVCGGLGPTHDDITRDAIAEVMNVPLVRDREIVERIAEMFSSRGRAMPESNGRQADVPAGATAIPQQLGTAPGLICPVGHKVVYALPGVPYELVEMFTRAVLPDLRGRADVAGEAAVIMSRVVRTWGMSESGLAELLAPRIEALDAAGGSPTIAFLASGIEGIKVRITAKAPDAAAAEALLDAEEAEVRALVGEAVFGVDDDHHGGGRGRAARGARRLTLGPGRIAHRWSRGVAAGGGARRERLVPGLGRQLRVGGQAHRARRARRARGDRGRGARHGRRGPAGSSGADVGLALTGVAGPDEQEGRGAGDRHRGPGAARGASPSRSCSTCPGTASGCASTRPSPPSTCCAAGCWPRSPSPAETCGPGVAPVQRSAAEQGEVEVVGSAVEGHQAHELHVGAGRRDGVHRHLGGEIDRVSVHPGRDGGEGQRPRPEPVGHLERAPVARGEDLGLARASLHPTPGPRCG